MAVSLYSKINFVSNQELIFSKGGLVDNEQLEVPASVDENLHYQTQHYHNLISAIQYILPTI